MNKHFARSLPRTLLAAAGLALLASAAMAQLAPERTYYGVGRPVPFSAKAPEGKAGDLSIQLFAFGGKDPLVTQSIAAGTVDLASLFPQLWKEQKPQIHYAQLVVGAEKVGPPVVLQPLADGAIATAVGSNLSWQPGQGPYSGIRAYVDKLVVFDTTEGVIEMRMRPDQAPNTVWNFLELTRGGFYTDILFHRIINKLPGNGHSFMIQVGDPTGTGGGGPGYSIDLEQSKLAHTFGVISMARESDPNTNGSQIFICLSREGTGQLDGKYCAFGQAVAGADVIEKIAATPTTRGDRPANESSGPKIKSAKLVDAPPFGTGPEPVKKPGAAAPAR